MTDATALLARLQLPADATERDVRRAYARELKLIDQLSQPEEFQALRETYERLIWWLRQSGTAGPSSEGAMPAGPPPPEPSAVPAAPAEAPETRVAGDTSTGSQETGAQAEVLGRELVDVVIQRLSDGEVPDGTAAAALLEQCLDDPRLSSVDARQFFEWAIASILASGWKPGHEALFFPAVQAFGWREDRSRLQWLGRAGQIVDAAITELMAFDDQPSDQRAAQRDAIRALRIGVRPPASLLLRQLPIAEQVAGNFPHWIHVIAKPDVLPAWREWEAAIPSWRRALAWRPMGRKPAVSPRASKSGGWGGWILAFVVLAALGRLLGSSSPPSPPPSTYGTLDGAFSRTTQQEIELRTRLRDLGATRPPEPAPPRPRLDPGEARRKANDLSRSKVLASSCQEASALASDQGAAHARGDLGSAFDRFVMDCLVQKKGVMAQEAFQPSFAREQRRLKAELVQLTQPSSPRSSTVTVPMERAGIGGPSAYRLLPDTSGPPTTERNGLGLKGELPNLTNFPAESDKP